MKNINAFVFLIIASTFLTSCELVGDILEVGIWLGVILVVLIIAIVLWLLKKLRIRK